MFLLGRPFSRICGCGQALIGNCRHPTIKALVKKAYDWRLRALPYHYTAFYDAHTNGCSVMRPLFFSWPADITLLPIDRQWMLGDAIMVAPILLQGTDTVPAYFPAGMWYDLYNHSSIDTTAAAQHRPVTVNSLPQQQVESQAPGSESDIVGARRQLRLKLALQSMALLIRQPLLMRPACAAHARELRAMCRLGYRTILLCIS